MPTLKQLNPQGKKAIEIISYDAGETGKWSYTEKGQEYLSNIKSELMVVSIAGEMRKGKSYLMNLCIEFDPFPDNQNNLFELGQTTKGKTRGIWAFAVPYHKDPSKTVLLLDTEGMFDPERPDAQFDAQIFILSILASSVFVYNMSMTIDMEDIKRLNFISELGDHLQLSNGTEEDDKDFVENTSTVFPEKSYWVVRDFMLKIEGEDGDNSDNGYMKKQLSEYKVANNTAKREYNAVVKQIKTNFAHRDCTTLVRPVLGEDELRVVGTLPMSAVREEFTSKVNVLIRKIFDNFVPKKIKSSDGSSLNFNSDNSGKVFSAYISKLLEQLNTSQVFNIQDAFTSILRKIGETEFTNAVAKYQSFCDKKQQEIEKNGPLQSEDINELSNNVWIPQSSESYNKQVSEKIRTNDPSFAFSCLKQKRDDALKALHSINMVKSLEKVETLVQSVILNLEKKLSKLHNQGGFADFADYKKKMNESVEEYHKDAAKFGPAFNTGREMLIEKHKNLDKLAEKKFELDEEKKKALKQEREFQENLAKQAKQIQEANEKNEEAQKKNEAYVT